MHEREDKRYAPPLNMAEEAGHAADGGYPVAANSLPARRALAWFGLAWGLFWRWAGWWFALVLAWTILSYILSAVMQVWRPSFVSFSFAVRDYAFVFAAIAAVRDFALVFATAGVAYAAERMERQARIDWRAGLVVLVRCAGALALLGLLSVVFEQLAIRAEAMLESYAANMQFQSAPSPLLGLVVWINAWKWLFFVLAYLLPNGVAPMLVVCRGMSAGRAWAAGWRGVGRNAGAVVLAAALATLLALLVRLVLGVAVALAQPEFVSFATRVDAVPPVWMMRIVSLAGNMVDLLLMLVLYAACRDVFFKADVKQAT